MSANQKYFEKEYNLELVLDLIDWSFIGSPQYNAFDNHLLISDVCYTCAAIVPAGPLYEYRSTNLRCYIALPMETWWSIIEVYWLYSAVNRFQICVTSLPSKLLECMVLNFEEQAGCDFLKFSQTET